MTDAAAPAAGPAGNPTPDDSTSNKKQKREVTVRAPPAGCNWQSVPKDGNCLFHAVGAGLRWLKHQPSSFHHLDLRARVADHLDRHKTDYEPAWAADGKPGPDGKPMDGWSDFVTAVGTPSSFSGEVELKALCRLFSIRLLSYLPTPSGLFAPTVRPSKRMLWQFFSRTRTSILSSLTKSTLQKFLPWLRTRVADSWLGA